MRSVFDLVNDEGEILGPGTDLVISLVAILVLLLAIHFTNSERKISELESALNINKDISQQLSDYQRKIEALKDSLELSKSLLEDQDVVLKKIRQSQIEIINEISSKYKVSPITRNANQYKIPIYLDDGTQDTIRITNDATLQRISFGSAILFDDNEHKIKLKGRRVLVNICSVFKKKLDLIKEIQIQGHASADSKSLDYYSLQENNDNLDLAGRRANSIVRFYRDNRRLDLSPAKHVIYASSFGYYMPVEREYLEDNWDLQKISDVNKINYGEMNKRIEIVLNYKEVGDN